MKNQYNTLTPVFLDLVLFLGPIPNKDTGENLTSGDLFPKPMQRPMNGLQGADDFPYVSSKKTLYVLNPVADKNDTEPFFENACLHCSPNNEPYTHNVKP